MTTLAESVLESRASFELAALFVTWVVIALLVVVIGSLHTRLRRLERAGAPPAAAAPYSHLVGRSVAELVDLTAVDRVPRVLFFVSSGCASCRRLLNEIAAPSWQVPSAVVWTDAWAPTSAPDAVPLIPDGPRISAELGIRVTPFALVADADGRVVKAAPIASLESLGDIAGAPVRRFTLSITGERKVSL